MNSLNLDFNVFQPLLQNRRNRTEHRFSPDIPRYRRSGSSGAHGRALVPAPSSAAPPPPPLARHVFDRKQRAPRDGGDAKPHARRRHRVQRRSRAGRPAGQPSGTLPRRSAAREAPSAVIRVPARRAPSALPPPPEMALPSRKRTLAEAQVQSALFPETRGREKVRVFHAGGTDVYEVRIRGEEGRENENENERGCSGRRSEAMEEESRPSCRRGPREALQDDQEEEEVLRRRRGQWGG